MLNIDNLNVFFGSSLLSSNAKRRSLVPKVSRFVLISFLCNRDGSSVTLVHSVATRVNRITRSRRWLNAPKRRKFPLTWKKWTKSWFLSFYFFPRCDSLFPSAPSPCPFFFPLLVPLYSFYFVHLSFNDPPTPFRPFRINVSPRIRK